MKFVVRILAAFFVAAAALPAAAQDGCTDRTDIVKHLAQKFSETPTATGLSVNGGVIEILMSEGGRSWTIIITMPNGSTCLVAAGKHWENVEAVANLGPGV
jgi:hypothetical protein